MVTVRAFFMPEPKPRTKTKNDIKNQIINQTKKGEPNYGKSN